MFSMFLGAICKSICNHGHTATFFLVEKVDAIAESIHHGHKILSELRIVVIDIAAMEICYLILELGLFCCSILLEPGLEFGA